MSTTTPITLGESGLFDPSAPLTASGNLRRRLVVDWVVQVVATAAAVAAVAVLVIVVTGVAIHGASSLSFGFVFHNSQGLAEGGIANDLLTRAADVCLKERRPLVLCLRETPLNRIHLENMLRVHDAGATVMPAMPAFYYAPKKIDDLIEQFAFRVLAQLGLPQEKQYRWKGGKD